MQGAFSFCREGERRGGRLMYSGNLCFFYFDIGSCCARRAAVIEIFCVAFTLGDVGSFLADTGANRQKYTIPKTQKRFVTIG